MTQKDYQDISKALSLLWLIVQEQGGGTDEQKLILNDAQDVLRDYESCGGEV